MFPQTLIPASDQKVKFEFQTGPKVKHKLPLVKHKQTGHVMTWKMVLEGSLWGVLGV